MLCKNCGVQLTGTESVCPNCGTPVEKEEVAEVVPEEVVNQAPEESSPVESAQEAVVVQDSVEAPTPVENTQPVEANPDLNVAVNTPPMEMAEPTPEMAPDLNMAVNTQPEGMIENPVPVDNAQPMVPPTPETNTPSVDNQYTAVSNTPSSPVDNMAQVQAFSNSMNEPQQAQITTPQPVPQKGGSKTLVLVLILIILLAIGGALYFVLFKDNETQPSPTPTNNNTQEQTDVSNDTEEITASYGEYKFLLPSDYDYMAEEGVLAIYNKDIFYGIAVDYTNSFDTYKAEFEKQYPAQINDLEKTIDNRKYLLAKITSADEEYKNHEIIQFVTTSLSNEIFIGVVIKKDGTQITTEEYEVLSKIIDDAKKEESTSATTEVKDAGKDGVKIYTPSKDIIKFSE